MNSTASRAKLFSVKNCQEPFAQHPALHVPIFDTSWAIVFWLAYIWDFYVSEASVIGQTKDTPCAPDQHTYRIALPA